MVLLRKVYNLDRLDDGSGLVRGDRRLFRVRPIPIARIVSLIEPSKEPRLSHRRLSHRPLLVLSFESLTPAALSCYGSSWNQTPALDAIASDSCVFDRWIVRDDDPVQPMKSMFGNARRWLTPYSDLGSNELITDVDAVAVAAIESNTPFDQVTEIPLPVSPVVQSQIDQTHLATLIAEVIERDRVLEGDWGLMWLHTSSLARLWDAPRELFPIDDAEIEVMDAEESSFPTIVKDARVPRILPPSKLPESELTRDDWWSSMDGENTDPRLHPDFVTAWMRTYGCQVRLLDFLLDLLLDAMSQRDMRVLITGTSGFQLGQSGVIGDGIGPLRTPQMHVPMIVSDLPAVRMPEPRSDQDLGDVLTALATEDHQMFGPEAWCGSGDRAVETISNRAKRAVTTSSWFYVEDGDATEHLFYKPDDANDVNDVASLRRDVIEDLSGQGDSSC